MLLTTAGTADLPDLLPMVRAYCDFYRLSPFDERLTALALALIASPAEGCHTAPDNPRAQRLYDGIGAANSTPDHNQVTVVFRPQTADGCACNHVSHVAGGLLDRARDPSGIGGRGSDSVGVP
ncbi:hypothetical protein [Mycobacterium deserti]|uniref:Uncharacterized protein n=1 Tax=Mycobacterium deserti TaxID=2978347 RepID=A0ABT2MDB2_9MYCO|nr:hypothetical protein [Mycobacterium deserti]MCT7660246.1 hypothetical protein [Mycobacterium deserti]